MNDCIFCKIIAGEIPSETVYCNDEFVAILDAFPANKGHVLVLPKNHVKDAFEIDGGQAARAFELAVRIAGCLEKLEHVEGVNILQNNREAAGQTVFHFHIHIIPRFKGDSVNSSWKTLRYSEGEMAQIGNIIRKGIG